VIDPKYSQKSSLSSRFALGTALLLAGSFGLAATFLVRSGSLDLGATAPAPPVHLATSPAIAPSETAGEPASASAPTPPDKPASEQLVAFCSEHVTATRSFVVFRYGTCVMVDEPTTDPVADARARLEACEDPEARFVPELTADGNLLVSFREPVFHSFSPAERDSIQGELDRLTPALLTPKERVAAGDDWMPPTHARFGLLARRRMLEDAAQPVPVRVIRARQRVTAAR
jgi:hypothetical protein